MILCNLRINRRQNRMANYVLLYSGGGMPETEAEQAAVLQEWTNWYNGLGAAVVDPGNPFTPQAKSISSDGMVSDSPIGGMASGYTVIKADSIDNAVSMAQACPILKSGGAISVYETFSVV